jgi:hypothetical protein
MLRCSEIHHRPQTLQRLMLGGARRHRANVIDTRIFASRQPDDYRYSPAQPPATDKRAGKVIKIGKYWQNCVNLSKICNDFEDL